MTTPSTEQQAPASLRELLGGRRGALDASFPPVAFVLGWLVSGRSIAWGAAAALVVGAIVGAIRVLRGQRVTGMLASLAAVAGGALIALYTGRAQDFFLVQLLLNVASALAWTVSILIRWPLLGLVVGTILGQKTRWRRDPALLRAYSRASWIWVAQYLLRMLVFGAFWLTGAVVALGVARVALSWPLIAAVIAVSAVVFQRALPEDHPGLRHPNVSAA